MRLPFDHALERAWLYGLKLRVVTPFPCPADTDLSSDIGYDDKDKLKFVFYMRFQCYFFRIRTELLRIIFAVVHLLRSKI